MKSELTKHDWIYAKKKEEQGKVLRFDQSNCREFPDGFQLLREIESLSSTGFDVRDYGEAEMILMDLNEKLNSKPYKISMPIPDHEEDYIIQLDNGVSIWIETFDKYHGCGESDSGVCLMGFMFEDFNRDNIVEAAKWLAEVM
ncbi:MULTISPECIES: hypothetical protein [Bacillus]|uniref:hypothetical protein n=1 Tax=Bacillus TaxID=1386 RepID=UPI000E53236A|nr:MULTISPECIES: hypothetical protein [Bacillus subtilis group]MBT3123216.1 hypothetical protein [Bacillus inaquosorum]MCB5337325.1 hypothetical protein [Bacillus amyloliquefaciens]MCF7615367.1 hypothetical protein [Bacillus subtilis]MCL9628324.1 hypothetical protein [Bacillus subtilis]QTG87380.1 hypothetical protein J4048_20875 [Bacillus amyloliquefaciens]